MSGAIPDESSRILNLYLLIAQYPMLAARIRQEMRSELFHRGILTEERFEQEARERAVQSQEREGLINPLLDETAAQWEQRLGMIREHLTDFYFAYNLPQELLLHIIDDILANSTKSASNHSSSRLMFNPELAPLEMVLKQAELFESLPADERLEVNHHQQELVVVLLKSLISDQLAFIRISKQWFTGADFRYILTHRIGTGKIGGKAAGLLLAYKILQNTAPDIADRISVPRSYFIGADVFYDFLSLNHVENLNQKYKSDDQIRGEYNQIKETYLHARLPEETTIHLEEILGELGNTPVIVRSSSLLEDNFGTSFAGKYASYFCANQGSPKENLIELSKAIRSVYASVYNPDALLYRQRMGLLDYDERMAILLQEVQGENHRRFFFPTVAGVAYSFSPITWSPRMRREDGFVRMVMGLGTRAVDRVANDYPRLISLSHPNIRPDVTRKAIRYYSQHFIDLIDLEHNKMVTKPLEQVLGGDFHSLRFVASLDDGDTIQPLLISNPTIPPDQLILTFDTLLQRTDFVPVMKQVLTHLAEQYQLPVDVEFAISIAPGSPRPTLKFHLLQCRPQNRGISRNSTIPTIPSNIPAEDKVFLCSRLAPLGSVAQVEYVVYVDPNEYRQLPSQFDFIEVARLIGQLNHQLEGKGFILIGPGRWGSTDYTMGIPVTYADIYNSRALIELAVKNGSYTSEPSYGTHFFQDLIESEIFPLAVYPDEKEDLLNWEFLNASADCLHSLLDREPSNASRCIKVIHIPDAQPGKFLQVVMDGQHGLGYLAASA